MCSEGNMNENGICEPCSVDNCASCEAENPNTCASCDFPFDVIEGLCQCPAGRRIDSNGDCVKCLENCN